MPPKTNTTNTTDANTTDSAADAAVTEQAVQMRRVIIQRPADNKDIAIPLGFNGTFSFYPFDVPVSMPADMVAFWRTQKEAVTTPGEDGKPVTTYVNKLNITDAPGE